MKKFEIYLIIFLIVNIVVVFTIFVKWSHITYRNNAIKISKSQIIQSQIATKSHLNIFFKKNARRKSYKKAKIVFKNQIIIFNLYNGSDAIKSALLNKTLWESSLITQIYEVMDFNGPFLTFVDIGCNLGVYSLSIATLQYMVVCVEPNIEGLNVVARSILDNEYGSIIMVHNAISDEETPIKMNDTKDFLNAKIVKDSTSNVWSIKFDNLLDVVVCFLNIVIIKIDVSSFETKALKYSEKFFDKCQVGAIQMEWKLVKSDFQVLTMMYYLYDKGFRPYTDFFKSSNELALGKYSNWPSQVIWRKLKCQNCSRQTWVLNYLDSR